MRTWLVKVIPESPAYDDRGAEIQIDAPLKRIAIAKARRLIKRNLTYDRLDGPLRFLATEILASREHGTRADLSALDNPFETILEPSESSEPSGPLPPNIGKLCRNGAAVYYTFPPHAACREASDWHDLV